MDKIQESSSRRVGVLSSHLCAADAPAAQITIALDYKSCNAYLALQAYLRLPEDFNVSLTWRPFKIREPEFGLCDPATGLPETSQLRFHWQRKNPQLFDSASKYAKLQGLELVGLTEDVDTTMALAGMLWVQQQQPDCLPGYHREVFAALWEAPAASKRDIEGPAFIASIIAAVGCTPDGFEAFAKSDGKASVVQLEQDAKDSLGVFMPPTCHFRPPSVLAPADGKPVLQHLYVDGLAIGLLRRALHSEGLSKVGGSAGTDDFSLLSNIPALTSSDSIPAYSGTPKRIDVYVDLKSPYAFISLEPTRQLAADFHVDLNWLPFTLDIPSYLGSARVGKTDNKVVAGSNNRSESQWRSVKYSYMDVRRYCALRSPPLTLYGTEKIWDSSLAGVAMLWAKKQGESHWYNFNDQLWPPFWRRELDIEDEAVLLDIMAQAGVPTEGFSAWAADSESVEGKGEGRLEYEEVQEAALAATDKRKGLFGVPTYVLDGESFWGREHLSYLRLQLALGGYARDRAAPFDAPYAR